MLIREKLIEAQSLINLMRDFVKSRGSYHPSDHVYLSKDANSIQVEWRTFEDQDEIVITTYPVSAFEEYLKEKNYSTPTEVLSNFQ